MNNEPKLRLLLNFVLDDFTCGSHRIAVLFVLDILDQSLLEPKRKHLLVQVVFRPRLSSISDTRVVINRKGCNARAQYQKFLPPV